MTVEPRSTESGVALVAVNRCQCIVEFAVKAQTPAGNKQGRGTVAPQSERVLLDIAAAAGPAEIRYEYGYVVGEPGAQHRPIATVSRAVRTGAAVHGDSGSARCRHAR